MPLCHTLLQAWWANSEKGHSHASSWLEARYTIGRVKFGNSVEFIKENSNTSPIEGEQVKYYSTVSDGLSKEEMHYINNLSDKMKRVREFIANGLETELSQDNLILQYETLKTFRRIIGNIDNDLSFLGCLLIKEFLKTRYDFDGLNMGMKPQGAAGLDLDEVTIDRKRIIGELKTTYPYQEMTLEQIKKSLSKRILRNCKVT